MTVGPVVVDLVEAVEARRQRDSIVEGCCEGVAVGRDRFKFRSLDDARAAKAFIDKMCPRLRTGPVGSDATVTITVGPPLAA